VSDYDWMWLPFFWPALLTTFTSQALNESRARGSKVNRTYKVLARK
jgi:hypothetical protein